MFRMVVRFKKNGEEKKAGVHSIGRSQPTWTHTEVICNKALFIEKKYRNYLNKHSVCTLADQVEYNKLEHLLKTLRRRWPAGRDTALKQW
jgi:hypothetical protein